MSWVEETGNKSIIWVLKEIKIKERERKIKYEGKLNEEGDGEGKRMYNYCRYVRLANMYLPFRKKEPGLNRH